MSGGTDEDRKALEEFVVGNRELEQLEALLDRFNFFEAIGAVRQELRHSDFLAFLLDPNQPHGLGDAFLRLFLQKVLLGAEGLPLPINLIDLDVWDLNGTTVLREWRNIDILLLNEANRFAVIIENKIDASESRDQLKRYRRTVEESYPGWNVVSAYLTPDGREPSGDDGFLPLSYEAVADAIEELSGRRASTLGADVLALMRHYCEMLRRHIVSGSEIDILCQRIYQKHRRALDLILERRPDLQAEIGEALRALLAETPGIIPDRASKVYISFTSNDLDQCTPRGEHGWSDVGRVMKFEFVNEPAKLRLILVIGPVIGPGSPDWRSKLFDIARSNKPPFQPGSSSLSPTYSRIWSCQFLSAKDYEQAEEAELMDRVRERWEHFLQHDLPDLTKHIAAGMNGATA